MLVGLVLLFFGAEFLVRGSSSLAKRLGLTPLVIGLTVVAYGTSMPETVVSVKAALVGQGDIAVGNVVGSNIFNIAVILGLAALVCPIRVQLQLIKVDAPIMIGVTLVSLLFFANGTFGRVEGLVFFAAMIGYTVMNVILARRETSKNVQSEFEDVVPKKLLPLWLELVLVMGGLAILVVGARFLVDGSVQIARSIGVSEAVIGLTIVAAGTSVPELATTIVAALRKEPDIAIGNVIGSNIFNLLGTLGIASIISPLTFSGISAVDLGVMTCYAIVLFPLICTGFILRRWEGGILLGGYVVYLFVMWPK
ncbi:calcium/sodium antiporter [Oscillatoria amoena NRMC-F 0135]|nr:calcium/sodium antiporter [Oscillatoria amoena NRMC-F 0135]